MFSFNAERYDFWPIYESIKKYYPLGITKNNQELFANYPGLKQLRAIVQDNVHHQGHYQSRWKSFENRLRALAKKPVIGSTYGQEPSFSAAIQLEKIQLTNRTIFREVCFAVSLVGSFYTVIGQDRTVVNLPQDRYIGGTSYLTVSPEGDYKDVFELVCTQIEQQFEKYRFVPFEIAIQQLEGLRVDYTEEVRNTIYHALFNHQIDLAAAVLGDPYFKYSDWTKDGYRDTGDGWSIYGRDC